MIFNLLIIHNYDRISSITQDLHTATWLFFISRLPDRFNRSPKAAKQAIMLDIYSLVQDFWSTSSDGAVGVPFFPMRCLLEILEVCSVIFCECRRIN